MIAAVVGSRGLVTRVDAFIPEGTDMIVTGGARGIDFAAEAYAKEHGIPCMVIRPDYHRYGRRAPLVRNREIIERADIVIAVWDGKSRGTKFSLEYARRLSKEIRLYFLPEQA